MRKRLVLCLVMGLLLLVGCSSKIDNPEDVLSEYLDLWSNEQYEEMPLLISDDSLDMISQQELNFEDRYETVYTQLGIENIKAEFQELDFKKEDIDLKKITEIIYPVSVSMDSLAGEISYEIDIKLVKEVNSDGEENWKVQWHPSQLFDGLEDPSDRVSIDISHPSRGEIFDRNGKGLAVNGDIYQVSIVPERTENIEGSARRLAMVLSLDEDRTIRLATQYPNNPDWAAPIQNIPVDDSRVESLLEIPGVLLGKIDGRIYPHGNITGHLIGHLGSITADELEEHQGQGYTTTSIIGKNGLELVYEDQLRGTPGAVIMVSDESGQNSKKIAEASPIHGEDVHLTIDIGLQRKLIESLNGETAGGVVMDPITGEVLAMVSEPAYDSNLRYLGLTDPRVDSTVDTGTLFERRFQNNYSPGSIFKPFTAVMALEEGILDPEEKLTIEGKRWQLDPSWGGYHVTRVSDVVSQVDLNTAMMRSDNIYFAKQAINLGKDNFESWAGKFGFGESIPFEFPMYESTISNAGVNSDILLADSGYGQGEILVSPLHMTAMYSIFLNDGNIIQPRLTINQQEPEFYKENIASEETIITVTNSLIEAVENTNGTAYRSDSGHSRRLAGKTGTAELKEDFTQQDGSQIGWYVSFDYQEKDMLVTVMVQEVQGRGGSSIAVDISNRFWASVDE